MLSQFFLPDRKNRLASVKPLHEHRYGFFLHLLWCHLFPPPFFDGLFNNRFLLSPTAIRSSS
jgi:hypothetical protein